MSRTFNTLVGRLSQIAETAARCGGRDVNGRQNSLDSEVNRNFPCNTIINCGCQFLKDVGIYVKTFHGLNTAIIREIPRRHRGRIYFIASNARARIWRNDKRSILNKSISRTIPRKEIIKRFITRHRGELRLEKDASARNVCISSLRWFICERLRELHRARLTSTFDPRSLMDRGHGTLWPPWHVRAKWQTRIPYERNYIYMYILQLCCSHYSLAFNIFPEYRDPLSYFW